VKDFKWLIRENIPCWYELSWDKEKTAIILRIHRDFVETVPIITSEHWMIKSLMGKFKFQNFFGDLKKDFGFSEGIFKNLGEVKNDFFEYLIPIPKIKTKTDDPCKECEGTGKDLMAKEFFQEKRGCLHCGGTGKEYLLDWKAAHAVSATFTFFFSFSNYPAKETSAIFPQLMTIETMTDACTHGGSLSGEFSVPLVKWLRSIYQGQDTSVPEISQAMKSTYISLFGELGLFDKYSFKAYIGNQGGGLVADCPGQACGIHPSNWDMREKEGYQFSCHNVDTAAQQITLLAGLAALSEKAKKEIKF